MRIWQARCRITCSLKVPGTNAVESTPHPLVLLLSPFFYLRTDVNGRFSTLLVFLPSPERQGNNGRADARSLGVSERKDACITPCQGSKSWRNVAATLLYTITMHAPRCIFSVRFTLLVCTRMRQSDETVNITNCTDMHERCRYINNIYPEIFWTVLMRNVTSLSFFLSHFFYAFSRFCFMLRYIKYDPICFDFMLAPRCIVHIHKLIFRRNIDESKLIPMIRW